MVDKERQLTIVEQFEDSPIRKLWHEGEWWYSLVDIMAFIVGNNRAGKYWYDLKKKLMEEVVNKSLLANIKQLKIQSTNNNKYYKSDMANFVTARSILQSVSLPSRERFLQPTQREIEKNIEDALANDLRSQGFAVKQQVCCANGRADIVTSEAIYEVKAFLTRDCIYKAIGQLFSYQRSISPSANLFIVGCKPRNKGEQRIEASLATSLGIEVMVWDSNNLELFTQIGKLEAVRREL